MPIRLAGWAEAFLSIEVFDFANNHSYNSIIF